MTKRIHKYQLDQPVVQMPVGAEILDVQMQGRTLCAWAIVDLAAPTEPRTFMEVNTGEDMPNRRGRAYVHLATVQVDTYVKHIFEVTIGVPRI